MSLASCWKVGRNGQACFVAIPSGFPHKRLVLRGLLAFGPDWTSFAPCVRAVFRGFDDAFSNGFLSARSEAPKSFGAFRLVFVNSEHSAVTAARAASGQLAPS